MASRVTEPLPPAPGTLSTELRGAVGGQRQQEQGVYGFQAGGVCPRQPLRILPSCTDNGAGTPELVGGLPSSALPGSRQRTRCLPPCLSLPLPRGLGPRARPTQSPGGGGSQGHGQPRVLFMPSKMGLICLGFPPWSSVLLSWKTSVAGPLLSGPARGQLVLPILSHLPLRADSSPIPPLNRTPRALLIPGDWP